MNDEYFRVKYVDRPTIDTNKETSGNGNKDLQDSHQSLPVIIGPEGREYSPLLAVANSLLLMGRGLQLPSFGADQISKRDLLNEICTYALTHHGEEGAKMFDQLPDFGARTAAHSKPTCALGLDGCVDEFGVASALDIDVRNGTLLSGKGDDDYGRHADLWQLFFGDGRTDLKSIDDVIKDTEEQLVLKMSVGEEAGAEYNALQRKLKLAESLRSRQPKEIDEKRKAGETYRQLTPVGYRAIKGSMEEGQVSIVCFDNKARTVLKRDGELYALVSHEGGSNVLFERMDSIYGKRRLCDSDFQTVSPASDSFSDDLYMLSNIDREDYTETLGYDDSGGESEPNLGESESDLEYARRLQRDEVERISAAEDALLEEAQRASLAESGSQRKRDSMERRNDNETKPWNTELAVALELRGIYLMNAYINTCPDDEFSSQTLWEQYENWDHFTMLGSNPIRKYEVDILGREDLPQGLAQDAKTTCRDIMDRRKAVLEPYLYETAKHAAKHGLLERENEAMLLKTMLADAGVFMISSSDERIRRTKLIRSNGALGLRLDGSKANSMNLLAALAEKKNKDAVYLLAMLSIYVADEPSFGAVFLRLGATELCCEKCMYEMSMLCPNTLCNPNGPTNAFDCIRQQYLLRASQGRHLPATLETLADESDAYETARAKYKISHKLSRHIQRKLGVPDEICALAAANYFDDKRHACSNPNCCRWAWKRTKRTVEWLEGQGQRRKKPLDQNFVRGVALDVAKAFDFIFYKDLESAKSDAINCDGARAAMRKEVLPNVRVKDLFFCCKDQSGKDTYYCGRACQLVDYHQHGHKMVCRRR